MREGDRVKLTEDFRDLGIEPITASPLYAQLFTYVSKQPTLINFFDALPPEKHQPALLMAAVRYLTMSNPDEDLSRLYATPDGRDVPQQIETAFFTFCDDYEYDLIRIMRNRMIQTNETNRCNALLLALMKIQRVTGRGLALIEVGASAGLNLLFDRYRYDYAGGIVLGPPGAYVRLNCELRKKTPTIDSSSPRVDFRVGIDLEPIKFGNEEDERWVRACVWLGDVGAEQRLNAALELAKRERPDVREGDAIEELESVASEAPDTDELVIFNSFTMSWMTEEEREDFVKEVRNIGNYRSVWWITYEGHGIVPDVKGPDEAAPALLALRHIQPAGEELTLLARLGVFGEWMEWLDTDTTAW